MVQDGEQPPHNWPGSIKYITRPEYAASIDSATLKLLSPRGSRSKTSSSSLTKIKRITDKEHPAYTQFGLFVAKDLRSGSHIIDYMGLYHLPDNCDPSSDYDLSLRHESLHLGIDAARMGNEARMINDYRGIGKCANAKFESYVNEHGEVRMGVFVAGSLDRGGKQGIKKGQEILVSYGKGFWQNRMSATE